MGTRYLSSLLCGSFSLQLNLGRSFQHQIEVMSELFEQTLTSPLKKRLGLRTRHQKRQSSKSQVTFYMLSLSLRAASCSFACLRWLAHTYSTFSLFSIINLSYKETVINYQHSSVFLLVSLHFPFCLFTPKMCETQFSSQWFLAYDLNNFMLEGIYFFVVSYVRRRCENNCQSSN